VLISRRTRTIRSTRRFISIIRISRRIEGIIKTSIAQFLSNTALETIVGMPLGSVAGFYLDIAFSGLAGEVRFTGQAAEMRDHSEVFCITVEDRQLNEKWIGRDGQPGWSPEDLRERWRGSALEPLFGRPRIVRYYYDPEDRHRGLMKCGALDGTAAIRFSATDGEGTLLLYATTEYPCALEVVTDRVRCDEILMALEEFHPEAVDSILIAPQCQ
jgi:hypothetical protein